MTETTASMQEQLARRDHRIAVLEAICAAQTFRLTVLEAREGGPRSPTTSSFTLADVKVEFRPSGEGGGGGTTLLDFGNGVAINDVRIESKHPFLASPADKAADPRSELLCRAIAADKPLDAYARR